MHPGELAGMQYLVHDNPTLFPSNFSMMHNTLPTLQYNTFLSNLQNTQILQLPALELNPQYSSLSNSSTSDEAEEQQVSIIDERKQRRMISNRESARRSRMRKQKHLDELWSQVMRLRTDNHSLVDKLNHVSECHDKVVQENARLKEEASDLRQMVTSLQINALGDLDQIPCNNTAHLRPQSSNQSITSSGDLLN